MPIPRRLSRSRGWNLSTVHHCTTWTGCLVLFKGQNILECSSWVLKTLSLGETEKNCHLSRMARALVLQHPWCYWFLPRSPWTPGITGPEFPIWSAPERQSLAVTIFGRRPAVPTDFFSIKQRLVLTLGMGMDQYRPKKSFAWKEKCKSLKGGHERWARLGFQFQLIQVSAHLECTRRPRSPGAQFWRFDCWDSFPLEHKREAVTLFRVRQEAVAATLANLRPMSSLSP